jgi:dynein heavy chain
MFPSLVNCCTIDWFAEWPADALHSVAKHFLSDSDIDDDNLDKVMDMCIKFHEDAQATAHKYLAEAGRHYYVTPTSYLELIQSFLGLLSSEQREVALKRDRYSNGYTKLLETEDKVAVMKQELQDLQPKITVAQQDTAVLLEKIKVDEKAANETRVVVANDQAIAQDQADQAKALAESCQADLKAAIPALNKATKALNSIKKAEIIEVKNLQKPPANVRMTLGAVCAIFGEQPVKVAKEGGKPGEKVMDYWPTAQKMMSDSKFIERLIEFDKDDIDPACIGKVRKEFISLPQFKPEIVRVSSQAAEGLCTWVCAMDVYESVERGVRPKKAALANSRKELQELEADLAVKIAQLQDVQDKIDSLNRELVEATEKKEHLEQEAISCEKKLQRASKLIDGYKRRLVASFSASNALDFTYESF